MSRQRFALARARMAGLRLPHAIFNTERLRLYPNLAPMAEQLRLSAAISILADVMIVDGT